MWCVVLQVADRPVTTQGMRGMKTGAMGPGRQVADQSFFVGVLRNKVRDPTTFRSIWFNRISFRS